MDISEQLKENNERCLELFYEWLLDKDVSEKTIRKHFLHVEYFVNKYLTDYRAMNVREGIQCIDHFVGVWFIKNALWANKRTVRENGTSLKQFYQCMLEYNIISESEFNDVCMIVKENKNKWIDKCN